MSSKGQGIEVANKGLYFEVAPMKSNAWSYTFALLLALVGASLYAPSAEATMTCTAEPGVDGRPRTDIKLCFWQVAPNAGRRLRDLEQAANTDSVEIQFFHDAPASSEDPEAAPYMRVLFHSDSCTTMGYGGRQLIASDPANHKAAVCYVGWVTRGEYNTIRQNLYVNYNTWFNAVLFGRGTAQPGFLGSGIGMMPSIPATFTGVSALASGVAVGWTLKTLFHHGPRATLATISARMGRLFGRRPAPGTVTAEMAAAVAEAETSEMTRAARLLTGGSAETRLSRVVTSAASAGGMGATALIGGYFLYQLLYVPAYDTALEQMVSHSWFSFSNQAATHLAAWNVGFSGCLLSSTSRTGSADACYRSVSAAAGAADRDLHAGESTEAALNVISDADAATGAAAAAVIADEEATEEATAESTSGTRLREITPSRRRPLAVRPLTTSWGLSNVRDAWTAFFRPACRDVSDPSTCNTGTLRHETGFYRPQLDIVVPDSLSGRFH